MVGGVSKRDDALVLNSTNVFAALGSLKKKKKKSSDKESGSSKSKEKAPEKEVFWAPAPLTAKSWADVDDEDDDDYYATTAPPQSIWGAADSNIEKKAPERVLEVSIL